MKINRVIILIYLFLLSFQGVKAQTTYTDEEIGFERDKIVEKMLNRGVPLERVEEELERIREKYIYKYELWEKIYPSSEETFQTMSTTSTCDVPESERQALIDFYNSTNGPSWSPIQWDLTAPVCNWEGVTVSNGHVTGINLQSNNLSGVLNSTLSDLPNLQNLTLLFNNVGGDLQPLVSLTMLRTVRLINNDIADNFPNFFKNFPNLSWLDLSGNLIYGEFHDIQSGEYSMLRSLDLSGNNLTGEIPSGLDNATPLTFLDLASNHNLGGTIPSEIGLLPYLSLIGLNNSNLIGEIPLSFEGLDSLSHLNVSVNNIRGSIPQNLSQLPNLEFLDIAENQMEGKIPFFQQEMKYLLFEKNGFIFSDFESEHEYYSQNLTYSLYSYRYSPQAKVDQVETRVVSLGSTLEIGTELHSPNNTYQWYHNGVALPPIVGVNKLIIDNVDYGDAGEYYFTATNSVVDSLTLERYPVTVEVVDGPVPGDCTDCYSFKPVPGKNYVLSGWVKELVPEQVVSYTGTSIGLNFKDGNDNLISSSSFYPSGEIIETWQRISNEFTVPLNTYSIEVVLSNDGGVESYFDDIRIHPFNGSMKSFVYDPVTQRLMAELDENNYSTFYEYDLEGGLIRTKKETQRGVYTIQEARSKNSINN